MTPIRIYILEDEIITQETLREFLENFGYEVCGIEHRPEEALEEIRLLQPDFAILDINLKGEQNGVWVGEQLDIPFIYLTAYNDPKTIHSALKTQPSSYLIKPFQDMQVFAAIELAMKDKRNSQPLKKEKTQEEITKHYNLKGTIVIKDGHAHYRVNFSDILYIKSDGKYIELHLKDKRLVLRSSMNRFLETYSPPNFAQIHKSYVINFEHVISYTKRSVQLENVELPISRNYKNTFLESAKLSH